MKKLFFNVIIMICIFQAQASASSLAGTIEKGNRLYHTRKYEEAVKVYDQALSNQPDSAVINFNAGTAQYKTNDYQKANIFFEKSLIAEDKSLEAKASYNLGNSRYMLGVSKENTDLSGTVQLLEGALTNYNRTLELAPKDEDAKVNYKIVEKKLKELKEKLKQQPRENKDNQKQREQNQEQAQKQQGESQEGQEKQAQAVAAQSQESKEMSEEEANMLLEGHRQEENTIGSLKDDRKGAEEKVLKDW